MMFSWEKDAGRYAPGWFIGSEDEDGTHRRDHGGWPYSIYRKAQEPGVIDAVLCHGIQNFGDATELHRRITQAADVAQPAAGDPAMALLTEQQRAQMLENGRVNAGREDGEDFPPVVRLFCPWSHAIWLLTELDPEDPDIAFGLCDPGLGLPELGSVRLSEMASIEGPSGQRIQRDDSFTPQRKLSTYARLARIASREKK
jgi:hypothetical protein